MKRLMWLLMLFSLVISGCAINGNRMMNRGFGWVYEGTFVNPTQYTITVSNSSWENDVTISPESGMALFLPRGRTYLVLTYYDGEKIIGRWDSWEYINPTSRKYFFEDEFYWWQIIIKDPMTITHQNLLKRK